MKKIVLVYIIALMLMPAILSAWREEHCGDGGACLIMEQVGGDVKVLFQNRLPMKNQISTVTFEVSPGLVNLRCGDMFPMTKVVAGPDIAEITTLSIIDPAAGWNSNLRYYWQYGSPSRGKESAAPYRLPFLRGKRFRVLQGFRGTVSHFAETEYAVDFRMPVGEEVRAARGGVVLAAENGQEEGKLEPSYRTKSNYVLVQHDDGTVGRYYHLVKGGVRVSAGQEVNAGDLIGLSGNSGYSDVPHLHFEVSRPADGKSKRTIPFTFITDYSESDTPAEGVVYSDNNLPEKRRAPVFANGIVLCRSIRDLQPAGVVESLLAGEAVEVYLPIDIPGEHSIRLDFYHEQGKSPATYAAWRTGKTWWYTSYTLKGNVLRGGAGKWRAEVSVNGLPVRTLEFTLYR